MNAKPLRLKIVSDPTKPPPHVRIVDEDTGEDLSGKVTRFQIESFAADSTVRARVTFLADVSLELDRVAGTYGSPPAPNPPPPSPGATPSASG